MRTLVEDYLLHCANLVIRDVCFLSERRYKFNAQSRTLCRCYTHHTSSNVASCTVPDRVPAWSMSQIVPTVFRYESCPTYGCSGNIDRSRSVLSMYCVCDTSSSENQWTIAACSAGVGFRTSVKLNTCPCAQFTSVTWYWPVSAFHVLSAGVKHFNTCLIRPHGHHLILCRAKNARWSEGFPRTRITKSSCACDCGRGPVSVGAFFLSSFFFFSSSLFFLLSSSSLTQNRALKLRCL